MSDIHTLFNLLVEQREVKVQTITLRAHDNLRIRLVKYFKKHKNLLVDIGAGDDDKYLSLRADFVVADGTSIFTLGLRRTKHGEAMKNYEIIS